MKQRASRERRHSAETRNGIVLRPEAVVLGEEALIPESNVVDPVPSPLAHELTIDEPYWYDGVTHNQRPSGMLPSGTPVAIIEDRPDQYRVVDGRGLAVDIRRSSVRRRREGSDSGG